MERKEKKKRLMLQSKVDVWLVLFLLQEYYQPNPTGSGNHIHANTKTRFS